MSVASNSVQIDFQQIEPIEDLTPRDPRLVWKHRFPMAEEKYRILAHRIQSKAKPKPLKKVLVTSSIPGEGKSTTAANLAIVLARSDRRVLLVDGDFRVPRIHESLGIPGEPGMAEVIDGQIELGQAIRRIDPLGLYCLPAGSPRYNPLTILESPVLNACLAAAEMAFEWIIIDSPPLNPFADAHHLAALSDGVVLVVRWDLTPRDELEQAIKGLKGAPLLGIVVNGYDEPRHDQYYYKYYNR